MNGGGGGDHVIYVDFKKRYDLAARIRSAIERDQPSVADNLERCRKMAGVAVIDVSGHKVTDVTLAAMMHQAFLLGALYELDSFGHITKRLFENLNTRFYNSSCVNKFVTMLYGEISEDATFRFVTAGHPFPMVFSNTHDEFLEIPTVGGTTFPPIGMVPSRNVIDHATTRSVLGFKERYELNEWTLMGSGDILLLCTDGVSEHANGNEDYAPNRLETVLRGSKNETVREIFEAVRDDLVAFAPPSDDVTLVVIKRR